MSTLTIMTQILTNYEKAGNHVTAVDIWLFVCLIMVFLALMEYAVAYTISHYYDTDFDDPPEIVNNVYNHHKTLSLQGSIDTNNNKQFDCDPFTGSGIRLNLLGNTYLNRANKVQTANQSAPQPPPFVANVGSNVQTNTAVPIEARPSLPSAPEPEADRETNDEQRRNGESFQNMN